MARSTWFEILLGAVFCLGAMLPAAAASLDNDIAAASERAYIGPREALYTLAKIQAAHSPLSTRHQALVYEHLSYARFHTRDYSGALQDARRLEALGKQQHDASIECLGVLSQAYPHWMMGDIQTAYALTRRAEACPDSVSAGVRVKVLMAKAQIESEERQPQKALQTVAQAIRLADAAHDDALLFMSTKTQVVLALAANDRPLALAAVDRLLSQAMHSTYPERLVRAKDMEYTVTSAAGLTARASRAIAEQIRLMRQLQFNEVLGQALVEYSDFQLKSQRYADAAALSKQALMLESVLADEVMANIARFNHAIATIHLGQLQAGKEEVERMFKSTGKRAELLTYLPEYIAVLTQAGDVDASMQASALQQQIESEETLYRARQKSEAQSQIDTLARLSEVKALEALNERKLRKVWLIVAATSAIGLIAFVALYGRLRVVNRLLQESNGQLYTSSNRDLLTGLFNRRYVETCVPSLPESGLVLLMDIDHFKQVNDTHGHAVGDEVLRVTAARLSALFRNDDVVARWGGEEFLALLPTTDAGEAAGIAARVLAAVSSEPVAIDGGALHVTLSLGVCSLGLALQDKAMDWQELVHLADQCLYLAKQRGRNRAYGITDAAHVTSAEMARGLRANSDEGKVTLLEVLGGAAARPERLRA